MIAVKDKSKFINHQYFTALDANIKKTLVVISGSGEGVATWLDFLPNWLKNFNVLLIDNPGVGKSDPRKDFTAKTLAIEYQNIINSYNINKFSLMGHSFGAFIALELAYNNKKQVEKLIIISGGVGSFMQKNLALHHMELIDNIMKNPTDNKHLFNCYKILFNNKQKILTKNWIKHKGSNLKGGMFSFIKASYKHSFFARLKELKMPSLIVHGKYDNVICFENALIMHELLPNSYLLESETGHYPFLEKDDEMDNITLFINGKTLGNKESFYKCNVEELTKKEFLFNTAIADECSFNDVISQLFKDSTIPLEQRYKVFYNFTIGK